MFTNTYALLEPEVLVARAHEKFDANRQLTDAGTRDFLRTFIDRFAELIERFVSR